MNIDSMTQWYENLVTEMEKDPEKAFQTFESTWSEFSLEERKSLAVFLVKQCNEVFESKFTDIKIKMYWIAIGNMSTIKYIEDGPLPIMNYNPDEDIKKLVKVFHELKTRGYIKNTNEEIAKIMAKIFDLNYATIFSYLNSASHHLGGIENILDSNSK